MRPQDFVAGTGGTPTASPRVTVVIPTFNEAKNLPYVFDLLPRDLHEVIVVDGHSVDGTVETARRLRPDVVVVQQNRRGKGNALACGFARATGDIVVMLDADGSADPGEIPLFVQALVDGADYAKGSRFTAGGGSGDITATRAWGNRWLNRCVNVLFGTSFSDLCYGYNAFWSHCLPTLDLDPSGEAVERKLWGDGFEIETIINTRAAKGNLRIIEVPSYEFPRIHGMRSPRPAPRHDAVLVPQGAPVPARAEVSGLAGRLLVPVPVPRASSEAGDHPGDGRSGGDTPPSAQSPDHAE
jgi:glycosyltransferase involved in cell wall biosynthesis